MNTDTLKMFIVITQKGSISKAAEKLGYAQSNISTKVRQLENDLNVQLFYRNNRGITLTEAGKSFYQKAEKIVGLTQEAIDSLKYPEKLQGTLRIGSLQTSTTSFLPKVLSTYHGLHPEVELRIKTGTTLDSANKVLSYQLDGAIIGGSVSEPDLVSVPLFNEQLCLATANDSKNDIENSSLLVFPSGCAYRKTLESWLDSKQILIHNAIEFDYLNAIVASISAGLGISILPTNIAQPFSNQGALKIHQLPEKFDHLPVSFIYRKDYVMSDAFTQFIKILQENATIPKNDD